MKLSSVVAGIAAAASGVSAGACNNDCPCGAVINNSGYAMRYTANPSTNLSANSGRCQFWNWYSSDSVTSLVPQSKLVSCSQSSDFKSGKKGSCSQNLDVDGFTFPYVLPPPPPNGETLFMTGCFDRCSEGR